MNILIIGSGGLHVAESGEFDYAGLQAIKAFKQDGHRVILINPNIATVQTDHSIADEVYFVPLEILFISQIIAKEGIQAITFAYGGQVALNLGIELYSSGILGSNNIQILGPTIDIINRTKNQDLLHEVLERHNIKTLKNDKLVKGWKKIEYELVRDLSNNSLIVCNMESIDAVDIHLGESIIVIPAQTISDLVHLQLCDAARKCATVLNVIGECNVEFALNPMNNDYYVIKINPCLSRSGNLAAKATGYPIAFIAAKIYLGYSLDKIESRIIAEKSVVAQPDMNYVVVKIPRWDTHKLRQDERIIGSEMKSIGEVMGVGGNFAEALQKSVQMLNIGASDLYDYPWVIQDLTYEIEFATDRRIFALFRWFFENGDLDEIAVISNIDRWFLQQIQSIADFAKQLEHLELNQVTLKEAKQLGFSDITIAKITGLTELEIRKLRLKLGVIPVVGQINLIPDWSDNYLYVTYNSKLYDIKPLSESICIIGSGPYSIGSSIEFDWCSVNLARQLRDNSKKVIIINSNPAAVSTDFTQSDRLYFEPLCFERVQDILDFEQIAGVCISVGGHAANNLASPLHKAGYPILGTLPQNIDRAENRELFYQLLKDKNIDQPRLIKAESLEQARQFITNIGLPVIIRPSHILSGAAMKVVFDARTLEEYLKDAFLISKEHPVIISEFIENAKELEIDGVANKGRILIHAISEHVENAGVHSGDATIIFPPERLYIKTVLKAKAIADVIVAELKISGPFNIQFIAKHNELKVIACNVRASRSFPFISKVTGNNLIKIAANVFLANPQKTTYNTLDINRVGVKSPVFSYNLFKASDPVAHVEMSATGEVACIGDEILETFYMSWLATGQKINGKKILLSLDDKFKENLLPTLKELSNKGWEFVATEGTHDFLVNHGLSSRCVFKISDQIEPNIQQEISNLRVDLIINLPRDVFTSTRNTDGFAIRRLAIDYNIPLITNVNLAEMLLESISLYYDKVMPIKSYNQYLAKNET